MSDLQHFLLTDPESLLTTDCTRPEGSPRLSVKNMHSDMQPREKAQAHGCGVLSIPELWAIILRTGTPGFPITSLTRQMMTANSDSLHRLERRTRKEMLKFRGIGMTKAIQIEAVMELIRRYLAEIPSEKAIIKGSQDIAEFMADKISNLGHEELWVIYLNRRNQVISTRRITTGTATGTIFDIQAILKYALLEEAQSIILTHNHPSGNLKPSGPDDSITLQCKKGCEAINIRFLDHVILTAGGFYSYCDEGRL